MKKLYRFSPIQDEKTFNNAWKYLADELEKLSLEIFQEKLPITTLKIFAHYLEEYDYLYKLLSKMGPKSSYSSNTSFYIEKNEMISNYNIKYFGLRNVDPYRLHVGCGDYEIGNYEEFKKQHLSKSPFIREFRDNMLEIWHPDYDVLGYIIPKE
jgi:hypothetical protein